MCMHGLMLLDSQSTIRGYFVLCLMHLLDVLLFVVEKSRCRVDSPLCSLKMVIVAYSPLY